MRRTDRGYQLGNVPNFPVTKGTIVCMGKSLVSWMFCGWAFQMGGFMGTHDWVLFCRCVRTGLMFAFWLRLAQQQQRIGVCVCVCWTSNRVWFEASRVAKTETTRTCVHVQVFSVCVRRV